MPQWPSPLDLEDGFGGIGRECRETERLDDGEKIDSDV